MRSVSTHVLDTARGVPAEGVPLRLERSDRGTFRLVNEGLTDADGRMKGLVPEGTLEAGVYRVTFDTAAYFARTGVTGFFPEVTVVFEVKDPSGHYHVPLLVSPFGYSTYRGS